MSRIQELASLIAIHTDQIQHFLASTNQPTPSFDISGPLTLNLSPEMQRSRDLVIEASTELKELLQGPKGLLTSSSSSQLLSLRAICHYRMAHAFPVGEEATFLQISEKCGLNEVDVRRLLRHAMAHRIFCEPRRGVVAHTGASKLLAQDQQLQAWLGVCVEEMWPSATQTVPAMVKWPNSQEPFHTGFCVANETNDPLYTVLAKDPRRAARFAEGMSSFSSGAGYEVDYVVNHSLWSTIPGGLVVDVGGSYGNFMISVAKKYPSLNFVVQDLPSTIATKPQISPALEKQITFMAHDFLTEQPIKNADVYFFRWIFHNWSDEYSLRILRNLIPALKPQATILINDGCLPEPNTLPTMAERGIRSMDLSMLSILNAREREKQDWESIFKLADSRFRFLGVQQPPGSKLAFVEAVWDPTEK